MARRQVHLGGERYVIRAVGLDDFPQGRVPVVFKVAATPAVFSEAVRMSPAQAAAEMQAILRAGIVEPWIRSRTNAVGGMPLEAIPAEHKAALYSEIVELSLNPTGSLLGRLRYAAGRLRGQILWRLLYV